MTAAQPNLERLVQIAQHMIESVLTDNREGRYQPGVRYLAAWYRLCQLVDSGHIDELRERLVELYRTNPLTDRLMVAYHHEANQQWSLLMVVVEIRPDADSCPLRRSRRTRRR